jgi:nitrogen fixation NifU-like protein
MDIYRETILEHYRNPRNYGSLKNPDVTSNQINVSCGDKISIEITLKKKSDTSVVEAIRFSGEGCAIDVASASMLTEKVTGMDVSKVRQLTLDDVQSLLGTTLTPSRVKCAMLPLEAIHKALASV